MSVRDLDLDVLAGHRTAISRWKPSAPVRWYEENGLLADAAKILDYGCGKDLHPYLRFDPVYDPDYSLLAPGERYDVVMVNYVLNVLPLPHNRAELMLAVRGLLAPRGRCLIAVWRKGEEDTESTAGFQCGWSPAEWEKFLGKFWTSVERLKAPFLGWEVW